MFTLQILPCQLQPSKNERVSHSVVQFDQKQFTHAPSEGNIHELIRKENRNRNRM